VKGIRYLVTKKTIHLIKNLCAS